MKSIPVTMLIVLAGVSAIWLAATIDPAMLSGPLCGKAHCWRCGALVADLAVLIAAAFQQTTFTPARN